MLTIIIIIMPVLFKMAAVLLVSDTFMNYFYICEFVSIFSAVELFDVTKMCINFRTDGREIKPLKSLACVR